MSKNYLPVGFAYHPPVSSHLNVVSACAQIHHEVFAPRPLVEPPYLSPVNELFEIKFKFFDIYMQIEILLLWVVSLVTTKFLILKEYSATFVFFDRHLWRTLLYKAMSIYFIDNTCNIKLKSSITCLTGYCGFISREHLLMPLGEDTRTCWLPGQKLFQETRWAPTYSQCIAVYYTDWSVAYRKLDGFAFIFTYTAQACTVKFSIHGEIQATTKQMIYVICTITHLLAIIQEDGWLENLTTQHTMLMQKCTICCYEYLYLYLLDKHLSHAFFPRLHLLQMLAALLFIRLLQTVTV